jgi:hypothetical protein
MKNKDQELDRCIHKSSDGGFSFTFAISFLTHVNTHYKNLNWLCVLGHVGDLLDPSSPVPAHDKQYADNEKRKS